MISDFTKSEKAYMNSFISNYLLDLIRCENSNDRIIISREYQNNFNNSIIKNFHLWRAFRKMMKTIDDDVVSYKCNNIMHVIVVLHVQMLQYIHDV